jgi:quercetin dioxygenase-like cupin family protein
MRLIDLTGQQAEPITDYGSIDASSVRVADGRGDTRVHVVVFDPGGSIGPHEAGFGQLFVPLIGSGWIAGADGIAVSISPGSAGFVRRGEVHSKGSATGMTALMIQVSDLAARSEDAGPRVR